MGSDSDAEVMSQAGAALEEFGVAYEMVVASAHRSPERTQTVVTQSERDGAAVFIAGAGMAAHLPGVVASLTVRPVNGFTSAGKLSGPIAPSTASVKSVVGVNSDGSMVRG